MSGKIRLAMVTLLVVGALSVVLTGTASAQEETPAPAPAPFSGHGFAPGMGRHGGLEAAAEVFGMTVDELALELWGGTTLSDLAEEKGIDLQVIQDAMTAANEATRRDAIEQAVEDETITREHADWLLEGLDKGFTDGHSFGRLGGRGGFRSFGGFDRSGTRSGSPGMNPLFGNADA